MNPTPFSAALATSGELSKEEMIRHYACLGYTTREITSFLTNLHGEEVSERQVRRIRKILEVNPRRPESSLVAIETAIREELKESGSMLGYRSMCGKLRFKHKLWVRQDTVMAILALIDPEGSTQRRKRRLKRRIYRSKGPNFMWHCDGYDKLKRFGIAIHGCIDGYSRRVMWLRAAMSNNNPAYISMYFTDCVQAVGGCPQILSTDMGTENATIAVVQPVLRHSGDDSFAGGASHRYGKSTANQRIEAFWCQLRKQKCEWWMSFFKDLESEGHFNTAIDYHTDAIRFCFGPLIQRELDEFAVAWNNHVPNTSFKDG